MDEMNIRQQIEYDGKENHGYVNLGNDMEPKFDSIAKYVLVFMVVGMNQRQKLPVAYFLIDSLTGEQKASLVRQCVAKLSDIGVEVASLTFDGLSSNKTMAKLLGANITDLSVDSHCILSGQKLMNFFDSCHSIKLIRNTFGEKKVFRNSKGEYIDWQYIVELNKLRETEGLHLGNRLSPLHVFFASNKMKVKLATQLFSNSVADAMEFCMKELKLDVFKGAGPTIEFIRT